MHMNLQAKLTLWYVLLVVILVGSISGVDLATNMQQRFEATLVQAQTLKDVAGKLVTKTLNSTILESLRGPRKPGPRQRLARSSPL